MKVMHRGARGLAAAALVLAGAGCAGMGTLDDVLGGIATPDEVSGEVRYVDTRDREVELRTYAGRSLTVDYDTRTRVVYRQREYPVSALERGDEVQVRLRRASGSGDPYAETIYVRRSVREGDGGYSGDRGGFDARVERLDGRVEYVDVQRGRFEVRSGYGETVLVTLPYEARSEDVRRLRRLRRGDRVRLDVVPLNSRRVELYRFR